MPDSEDSGSTPKRVGWSCSVDDVEPGPWTASHSATSAGTSRATNPGVSRLGESGNIPSELTAPYVGLKPATALSAAGIRIEPAVSVPTAAPAMPSATATADPPLDPPAINDGSRAFFTGPAKLTSPVVPNENWWACVLPTTLAPRATSWSMSRALRGWIVTKVEPAAVGKIGRA